MNRHEIWLAGFTILSIINHRSSQTVGEATCETDKSVDNLKTLNCGKLDPANYYTKVHLPSGEKKEDIEVVYLAPSVPDQKNTVDLMGIHYHEFPNLKRVLIRNNIVIKTTIPPYYFNYSYTVVYKTLVEKLFSDCENLETLEISYSNFHELIQFRLPKNLKFYNIAGNDYRFLKISGSQELIEVDASSNPLVNIPLFKNPSALTVNTLRLKECPLGDMTLLDLAPLCELTLLELKLPQEHSFMNSNGYCNCTMLQKYAEEVSLEINSLKCYEPKSTEKISCPSSEYLSKARLLREKCPFKKSAFSAMATIILKYVFVGSIILILLAIAILYAIRHYHLREWWRERHSSTSPASSSIIGMEENEESMKAESSKEGSLQDAST